MAIELAHAPPPGERNRLLVHALCDAADFQREQGRFGPGRPMLKEAVEVSLAHLGHPDPDTAAAWSSLGLWSRYDGDITAAKTAYQDALAAFGQEDGGRRPCCTTWPASSISMASHKRPRPPFAKPWPCAQPATRRDRRPGCAGGGADRPGSLRRSRRLRPGAQAARPSPRTRRAGRWTTLIAGGQAPFFSMPLAGPSW